MVQWCKKSVTNFLCLSTRLMQYHQTVVKGSGGLPDELLYGRVGYLYSLVFINQQLGKDRIPDGYIQQVSQKQSALSPKFFILLYFLCESDSCHRNL